MKANRINTLARLTGMTMALALFAGIAGEVKAQEKGSARGGATLLMRPAPPLPPSDYKPMSCGKCKDEFVSRVDWSARGATKPAVLVSKHLCDGCRTDWTITGHGRAKRDVTEHKCTSCGAESLACCSTSKTGAAATKGMEKKFEVAPVK